MLKTGEESKSGYGSELDVYTGKKGDKVEKGLDASVVMKLTEKKPKNHIVYFDFSIFIKVNIMIRIKNCIHTLTVTGINYMICDVSLQISNLFLFLKELMKGWLSTKAKICLSSQQY